MSEIVRANIVEEEEEIRWVNDHIYIEVSFGWLWYNLFSLIIILITIIGTAGWKRRRWTSRPGRVQIPDCSWDGRCHWWRRRCKSFVNKLDESLCVYDSLFFNNYRLELALSFVRGSHCIDIYTTPWLDATLRLKPAVTSAYSKTKPSLATVRAIETSRSFSPALCLLLSRRCLTVCYLRRCFHVCLKFAVLLTILCVKIIIVMDWCIYFMLMKTVI